MAKKDMTHLFIRVNVTEAEEKKIRAAADKAGQTIGEYTRRALLAHVARLECGEAREMAP